MQANYLVSISDSDVRCDKTATQDIFKFRQATQDPSPWYWVLGKHVTNKIWKLRVRRASWSSKVTSSPASMQFFFKLQHTVSETYMYSHTKVILCLDQ